MKKKLTEIFADEPMNATHLMGCPNACPGKHAHATVLDLGILQVLLGGEHVGEGVEIISEGVEAHGIPHFASGSRQRRHHGERRRGGTFLRRCERRCGSRKEGSEGERKLGHGHSLIGQRVTRTARSRECCVVMTILGTATYVATHVERFVWISSIWNLETNRSTKIRFTRD